MKFRKKLNAFVLQNGKKTDLMHFFFQKLTDKLMVIAKQHEDFSK